MELTKLLSSLSFYQTSETIHNIEINSIEVDSRKVRAGDLFICIEGFTVDGHDYAEQAISQGAVAVIAQKELSLSVPVIIVSDSQRALAMLAVKFLNNPSQKLSLIGITGTNGKTTVSYLLEAIFKEAEQKTGLIGTIQKKIGDEAYPVTNTTPDSLELQKTFKQMVDKQVDTAIMEVSSHALDQGRVYGSHFDVAVFTNLSQDHLDYHKNMDDYLHAKSLLFSQLGNGYAQNKKYAIINNDDDASDLLRKSTAQEVITYGLGAGADVLAKDITLSITETTFTLTIGKASIDIKSNLIGKFNVYNMLAASAAALTQGISLETIKQALESIKGIAGRFEPVLLGQSFAVIVDYAHTPDSLENVLQTAKEFATHNVYIVVGCGGDRDRSKRPLMAQIAVKYADQAIFTSDNPRTEDPNLILDDMVNGLDKDETNYHVITNRKEAITAAINQASEEDVVIIAGKGHETYQQIGHETYDFDDRQVAGEAITDKEK